MTSDLDNSYNAVISADKTGRKELLYALHAYVKLVLTDEDGTDHIYKTLCLNDVENVIKDTKESALVVYNELIEGVDFTKDETLLLSSLVKVLDQEVGEGKQKYDYFVSAHASIALLNYVANLVFKKDEDYKKNYSKYFVEKINHLWQPQGVLVQDNDFFKNSLVALNNHYESVKQTVGLQALVAFFAFHYIEGPQSRLEDINHIYTTVCHEYDFVSFDYPLCPLNLVRHFNQNGFLLLHNEIKGAHSELVASTTPLSFDLNAELLIFGGRILDLDIRKESRPSMLLQTLLKDPLSEWSQDQITDDWSDEEAFSNRAVYDAAVALNKKIAEETTIKDFLLLEGMHSVQINPSYIKS